MTDLLRTEYEEIQEKLKEKDYSDATLEKEARAEIKLNPCKSQTVIAMDRDLCMKAIEQDIHLTKLFKEKLDETARTKDLIQRINEKPKFSYQNLRQKRLPDKPVKERFRGVEYAFAFSTREDVADTFDSALGWKILRGIINALIFLALYFLFSKGIAPKYENQTDLWYELFMMISWGGLILAFCALFSGGAIRLTPFLTIIIALCLTIICFIPLVFVNSIKKINHERRFKKVKLEYHKLKSQTEQENREKFLAWKEERKKAEEKFEMDWQNGEEERKEKTEKLEQIYILQCKELLAYEKTLNWVKDNVLTIPIDYDDEESKKEILAHLKNFKAVTFPEAIRYMESLAYRKEEMERANRHNERMLEFERKQEEAQAKRNQEVALLEKRNLEMQKEMLEMQKRQVEADKKYAEMVKEFKGVVEKMPDKEESYHSGYDPYRLTPMDIERAVHDALK